MDQEIVEMAEDESLNIDHDSENETYITKNIPNFEYFGGEKIGEIKSN